MSWRIAFRVAFTENMWCPPRSAILQASLRSASMASVVRTHPAMSGSAPPGEAATPVPFVRFPSLPPPGFSHLRRALFNIRNV